MSHQAKNQDIIYRVRNEKEYKKTKNYKNLEKLNRDKLYMRYG